MSNTRDIQPYDVERADLPAIDPASGGNGDIRPLNEDELGPEGSEAPEETVDAPSRPAFGDDSAGAGEGFRLPQV